MFFILISFDIILYLVCGGLAIKGLWGLCGIAMLLALGGSWLIDILYKSRRDRNNSSIYSNESSKETAPSDKVSGLVASSALVAVSSQDSPVNEASKKQSESASSWDCSGFDCLSSADCSSLDCHHPVQALDCGDCGGDCGADCDGADCGGCDHPIGIVILLVVGLFAGIWYLVKCIIPSKKPKKVKVFTSRKDKKKNKDTTEDSEVSECENKVEDDD